MSDITKYDQEKIYCRMLGGSVPFAYCRRVNDGLPCKSIMMCWEMKFEVAAFVEENFTQEEIEKFTEKRPGRLDQILLVLDRVKQEKKSD